MSLGRGSAPFLSAVDFLFVPLKFAAFFSIQFLFYTHDSNCDILGSISLNYVGGKMQSQIEQDCLEINTHVIKLVKIGKIKLKLEKERESEGFF